VGSLLVGAVKLAERVRALKAKIHGEGPLSAGLLSLLLDLGRDGAQTVPQLARSRSVTRQHIQAWVNRLVEGGYAELAENPAHKRSKLVATTPRGRELAVGVLRRAERRFRKRRRGMRLRCSVRSSDS
jgi:DNA-binding MarR family transcriptional regulator